MEMTYWLRLISAVSRDNEENFMYIQNDSHGMLQCILIWNSYKGYNKL